MAAHLAGRAARVHPQGTETGWELFGRRAVRRDDWKAVWLRRPEGVAAWQLYDLASDPGETRDRAADEPAVLHDLIAAWGRYASWAGVVEEPISYFERDENEGQ